jgi:hypothetical protein
MATPARRANKVQESFKKLKALFPVIAMVMAF